MHSPASTKVLRTRCCIVGGGPAGIMLAYLLARGGVEVVVLEKHVDFFRDFRGDTIHPSTLQVLWELGLLDEFLALPHDEVRQLAGRIGDTMVTIADFTHLPTRAKFLAFMPQWDFLNFLTRQAMRYPTFHLLMEAEATDLVMEGERVVGVQATTPGGAVRLQADLIVGADGRRSIVRERARLETMELGAPIDVLWMRLSRLPTDPRQVLGRIDYGKVLIMLDRDDYWQCGFVIRKGAFEELQRRGLGAFRDDIAQLAPFTRDRVGELSNWSDIKLLTVAVDRLRDWYRPGLVCIGDAAHAMSPIGGVGINLALQDAVAVANVLGRVLRGTSSIPTDALRAVQRRRELPTRVIQRVQVIIQDRIIKPILGREKPMSAPWPVRLLGRWPLLQRIPARVIGVGVRPEHVRFPDCSLKAAG